MITRLQNLLQEIRELENRVSEELGKEAESFGYSIRQGRVYFEQEIAKHHKAAAMRVRSYLAESSLIVMLTAPLVYGLLPPLVLLDVAVWVYQATCFSIYGVPKVRRSDYILLDRNRLRYLNVIERTHCLYCGYANGLIGYVQEVAARTEQYWCPIKHAQRLSSHHSRYDRFLSYGDADAYTTELQRLRRDFDDVK